ncbi:hypothetical protein F4774DRAFT_398485 [Daldinia eschscholtzii]|nr:hypothetical protein F4774DRAFT_398485 [Daldinia eschscholtzii]
MLLMSALNSDELNLNIIKPLLKLALADDIDDALIWDQAYFVVILYLNNTTKITLNNEYLICMNRGYLILLKSLIFKDQNIDTTVYLSKRY